MMFRPVSSILLTSLTLSSCTPAMTASPVTGDEPVDSATQATLGSELSSSPPQEQGMPFELLSDGRIPQLPHLTSSVAASPDGKKLAYATREGLFIGELGKTTKRVFKSGGPIGAISWSGDGKYIVLQAALYQEPLNPDGTKPTSAAPRAIVLLSVSDGTSKIILDESNSGPVASPDGRYIAVQGGTPSHPESAGLHLYDIQSGEWETLIEQAVVPSGYSWAPDGSALAFLGAEGPFSLAIVRVLDREVIPISTTDFETPDCWPYQAPYYWQANGSRVATYRTQADRSVIITSYGRDGKEVETVKLSSLTNLEWYTPVNCLRPAPSGAFLLGTRLSDIRQMFPTPADAMVSLSVAKDELQSIAPPMYFAGWMGSQDKFIGYSQTAGKSHYYLIDVGK